MTDSQSRFDFFELGSILKPLEGIDPEQFGKVVRSYDGASRFDDDQVDSLREEVLEWMRSEDGQKRYPAGWFHIQAQEYLDSRQRSRSLAEREDFTPPLAISLVGLADLHPWLAWHPAQNPSFVGDVVPALAVRLYGIRAHAQHHKHAATWDKLLRKYDVDPLGSFPEQAVKAERAVRIVCGERNLLRNGED